MTYAVAWDQTALDGAAGYLDDRAGLEAVMDAVDDCGSAATASTTTSMTMR